MFNVNNSQDLKSPNKDDTDQIGLYLKFLPPSTLVLSNP